MRLEIDELGFSLTDRLQQPAPATAVSAPAPAPAVTAQPPAPSVATPPALAEASLPASAEVQQGCAPHSAAWVSQGGLKHPLQPVFIPQQPQRQGQFFQAGWNPQQQQQRPPPQCEVCGGPHLPQHCRDVLPQDRGFFATHPLNRRGPPPSQRQRLRRPPQQGPTSKRDSKVARVRCCTRRTPPVTSCAPLPTNPTKLSDVQRRYATHERELLAVVHALKV